MRDMTARVAAAITLAACAVGFTAEGASASVAHHRPGPNFGPNVIVFNPSMPQATIQSTLDAIATQQVPNQFGTQRYAIFFEPGTYGSSTDPLIFQVGTTRRWRAGAGPATSRSMARSTCSTTSARLTAAPATAWTTSGVRFRT